MKKNHTIKLSYKEFLDNEFNRLVKNYEDRATCKGVYEGYIRLHHEDIEALKEKVKIEYVNILTKLGISGELKSIIYTKAVDKLNYL